MVYGEKSDESITNDIFSEVLSHTHLISTGKCGFQIRRKVTLSTSKYFNQQLLNYAHKFSSDSGYTFSAHSAM